MKNQIVKFNGRDSIMEVLSNMFDMGKVLIHFHKYDITQKQGQRITTSVDCFLDLDEALLLCQDILSGRINKLLEGTKGEKYPKPVWQHMGGVSATKLKKRELYYTKNNNVSKDDLKETQRSRTDGMSLSRVLKISAGSKLPIVFTAESGAGEEKENGLIVPKYGLKPDSKIIFGLTNEELKIFALQLKMHIQAYYTSEYVFKHFYIQPSNSKDNFKRE